MANISLFDPITTQMNRVLQNFWLRPLQLDDQHLQMRIDISEDDKKYVVRADIPGVKKGDINVDIDGNRISISAEVKSFKEEKKNETVIHSERYEGQLFRIFTLDSAVDQEKAQAKYQDGVLELSLPKALNGKSQRLEIH